MVARDYETIGKLKTMEISSWFTDEEKAIMKNKPIRKEIRDLTDDEWKKVYTAMNIMKFTDGDTGRSTYGDSFYSYDELVCWHTTTASSYNGDMGHGYPQFAIWHRAFMYLFEKSMLAVDSSIGAIPYWDYRLDENSASESIIFSEKYFGDLMGDSTKDYAIPNGPFAYWPIGFGEDCGCSDKYVNNIFGLMRSYINPNPSLYVSRAGGSLCDDDNFNYIGSSSYWDLCLTKDEFSEFNSCYESQVHTGGHVGIGGTIFRKYISKDSIEYKNAMRNIDTKSSSTWCHNWLTTSRMLGENEAKIMRFWSHPRNLCFSCNKNSCALRDSSGELKEFTDKEMSDCVCKLIDNQCEIDTSDFYTELKDEEKMTHIKTDLNSHLVEYIWGDMFDAISSPNDPIFFFHHINMDRYTMLYQIVMYDKKDNYYNYPTQDYEYGINLNDVTSPDKPFDGSLFDYFGDKTDDDLLTFKDIFDATEFVTSPYIYEDIYEAIFAPDSDYQDYMNQGGLITDDVFDLENIDNDYIYSMYGDEDKLFSKSGIKYYQHVVFSHKLNFAVVGIILLLLLLALIVSKLQKQNNKNDFHQHDNINYGSLAVI